MVISSASMTFAMSFLRLFVHCPFVIVSYQKNFGKVERVLVAVDRIQLVQRGGPAGDEASRQAADVGEVR